MSERRATSAVRRARWLGALSLVAAAGCGGPQTLGDAGATCFRDDDCSAGLICVAPKAGDTRRVCSDDPTPIVSMVDGPPVMEPVAGTGGASGSAGSGGTAGTPAGGTPGSAGTGGAAGSAGSAAGGANTAGSAGSAAGTSGAAGTAGTAGTDADGGAPP